MIIPIDDDEVFPPPDFQILTDEEIQKIILNLIYSSEKESVSEEEILQAIRWAELTVISNVLLTMVLDGDAGMIEMNEKNEPLMTFKKEVVSRIKDIYKKAEGTL